MKEYTKDELRLLAEILPGVGAELRGAVARMNGAVRKLAPEEAQEADPTLRENAAIFTQGYCRMLRLIGNLSAAESLAGELRIEPANIDAVGFCRDLCRECEALFECNKVALAFESDAPGCVLAADEEQLRRLMLNLLSNALRHTPAGGTVTVRVRTAGAFVSISVSDTGCGIAPNKLDTVFERFLHPEPLDASPHGVGLGLAICRRIAEAHGGRIMVESAQGEGATFTLSLPKRTTAAAQLRARRADYTGGLNPALIELSDALGAAAFSYLNLD
ncbi:MAG: sensor histidine kinase [Ruminococcaceae bacterium]|nr:sensor histidine kinase [Oscillospiraceae bacterium]